VLLTDEDQMSWEAASNIHRHTYKASLASTDSIPLEVKHEAIQKFRAMKRSSEEIEMSKQEMRNSIEYYEKQIIHLKSYQEMVSSSSSNSQYVSGCRSLISKRLAVYGNKLSQLRILFGQFMPGAYIFMELETMHHKFLC